MRHFDEARVCSKSVYYLEVLNMSVFGKVRVALGRVRHIFGVKINLNGSQSLIHSTLEIIRIIFFFTFNIHAERHRVVANNVMVVTMVLV